MIKKNDLIELTITGFTAEGNGVGRHEGMAVFVPLSAPGDHALVKIVKTQKNYAFGRLERLLSPADCRISPDCPVFGKCGGCTYRHISYEAELTAKQHRVEDAMRRIGGITVAPSPILGAKETSRYRNKAQYPVQSDKNGLRIGFYAPRSHRIIDCRHCALQPESFTTILTCFTEWIQEYSIPCYDEVSGIGLLRHIYLRQAEATGELMACAVINGDSLPHADSLVQLLTTAVPEVQTIVYNINKRDTNVILGDTCRAVYGSGYITDILCGVKIRISPLSFYQVNRAQAQRLYEQAAAYLCPDATQTVLDLYCGAGTIGLSLAGRVKEVIGVESVEQAVKDARFNAEHNGIKNARFLCNDAAGAAKTLLAEGVHPNAVIVDPPRKGCEEPLLHTITQIAPEKLIYVSCDPGTLARDCARLAPLGWQVQAYTPVDLFPKTAHCESIALLQQKK